MKSIAYDCFGQVASVLHIGATIVSSLSPFRIAPSAYYGPERKVLQYSQVCLYLIVDQYNTRTVRELILC